MSQDAFSFDIGSNQGRIPGPNGTFVFELGHALPNQLVELTNNDQSIVSQTADFTGTTFARAKVKIVHRTPPPGGYSWVFGALLDGDFYPARLIDHDATLTDIALPVWGRSNQTIAFALLFTLASGIVAAELPSVQIEQVVLDASTSATICNRNPEQGESGVPVNDGVSFQILPPSNATTIDPTQVAVYVNGVVAVSGGAAQTGFGIEIDTTADGQGTQFTVGPLSGFPPSSVVSVRVTYAPLGLDQSWSFSTIDIASPVMVSASAPSPKAVRVVWSKSLSVVGTYTLTLVSGAPAVTPRVVSATLQDDGSVLLALDVEQTRGAVYQVSVAGALDTLGNQSLDPLYEILGYSAPTLQFVGYVCQHTPAGRAFRLFEMLLEADREADVTGDLEAFVDCYQEVNDLLLCKIDDFDHDAVDPDTAVEVWLDRMLVDLGNPFGFDLNLSEKRKLVQLLVPIYRLKGTDLGIIFAIQFFMGITVTIATPWTSGWRIGLDKLGVTTTVASGVRRDLYSYQIVSPVQLTDDQRSRMNTLARYLQRAPCHLRGIVEPAPAPTVPNHWQLGLSQLGVNTVVHHG